LPEDLFVRAGTVLVRLGQEQEVTPFVAFSVEHNAEADATALKVEDRHSLNFLKRSSVIGCFIAHAEDIAVRRGPPVLGSQFQ
jgi:hypothetical protein